MTTEAAPCPVCEVRADISHSRPGDQMTVSCWECGSFRISASIEATFKRMSLDGRRARLSEAKNLAAPGQLPEVKAHAAP